MQIFQVLFFIVTPFLITKLVGKSKKLNFLSPILLCYVVGMILGNSKFIPIDKKLALSISEFTVPLAIPLILFSTDFKRWLGLARKTIISFILVVVGAITSSVLAATLFSGLFDEYWKLSGMLVGVYTGGTPNLMAIGMGLKINEETLILTNTADAILGGIYFLFLVTGAKWLVSKFLPAFSESVFIPEFAITKEKPNRLGLFFALFLSLVFVGISVGISFLFTSRLEVSIVMLVLTTLGIVASFVGRIRKIEGTYEAGQYVILIFSLAIGTTTNFSEMVSSSSVIFMYTAFVMTMAILIHFLLAFLFRIDVDTTIITSTAGIFGPAFIGPVAERIKNREVIVSGLTCGLVGYAIGNYLGFAVAWLLMPR